MVLLGIMTGLWIKRQLVISRFFAYISIEIIVICLLFLYWAMKIAGGSGGPLRIVALLP